MTYFKLILIAIFFVSCSDMNQADNSPNQESTNQESSSDNSSGQQNTTQATISPSQTPDSTPQPLIGLPIIDSIVGTYKGSMNFGEFLETPTDYTLEIVSGANSEGIKELIFLFSSVKGQLCTSYSNPEVEAIQDEPFVKIQSSLINSYGKIQYIKHITDVTILTDSSGLEIAFNRTFRWVPKAQPQPDESSTPRDFSTIKAECTNLAFLMSHHFL